MSLKPILATSVPSWQDELRNTITSGPELLALLGLTAESVGLSAAASADFRLKVPHNFVDRMQPGNPSDPLLLQVLASEHELLADPRFSSDPLQETTDAIVQPGILHKYHGRALLIAAGGCAVNCRYCFRRHFPYTENLHSSADWPQALAYIAADASIEEVILSGGDPLVLMDDLLAELINTIAAISHVRRIRIHTRLPIVIPSRVTPALVQAISHPAVQTVIVVHSNHANEIDHGVAEALLALRDGNITLLNQAVLLANINDDLEVQLDLCKRLFAAGTLPYYLHMLDKVQGALHFDVTKQRAKALHKSMAARLPGYLLPRLVYETPGAEGKTLL